MLNVKTPEEVIKILTTHFSPVTETEVIPLEGAVGRVLAEPLKAREYLPDFDRSTVDGYALRAEDTFGCSDALPAVLTLQGKVEMGKLLKEPLGKGCCFYIPTGGGLPAGANAVGMVEHAEEFGDGTVGITKAVAPGNNIIYRGDDLKPGEEVLPAGRRLTAADIGSFAALGITRVRVSRRITVGIISTGDELIEPGGALSPGQIRDVNSHLLAASVREAGCIPVGYGIVADEGQALKDKLTEALNACDAVLISGGSSAGEKDRTAQLLAEMGELLLHGIAIKPGKPTMLGKVNDKAVFGLAGHPGAAFFTAEVFVKPFLRFLMGQTASVRKTQAVLSENVSANHGRTQYSPVRLRETDGILYAEPVIGKSGLITDCAGTDAYMVIGRDCEGLKAGSTIEVYYVV